MKKNGGTGEFWFKVNGNTGSGFKVHGEVLFDERSDKVDDRVMVQGLKRQKEERGDG